MTNYAQITAEKTVLKVIDLNMNVKHLLETTLTSVWVEGEVSNVKIPYSGHIYFTLKDDHAQVRCVCFSKTAARLRSPITDGAQLLVNAKVTMYEARGDYQLIINDAEIAGAGALQRAFLALKNKLQAMGWFDQQYKQKIPVLPKTVGVITSATGAAVRDVLRVLQRRFPAIKVIIYPSMVQGAEAPKQLIKALDIANARAECEVLLLVRGGGSIEDLWAFNDAELAEAIFHSKIPIVTGIGHEVDFTIADFIADLRAATPSAAAECVSPDQVEFFASLMGLHNHMRQIMLMRLHKSELKLEKISQKLVHPGERIQVYQLRAARLKSHLVAVMQDCLVRRAKQFVIAESKFQAFDLSNTVNLYSRQVQQLLMQSQMLVQNRLQQSQYQFRQTIKSLELLNPLAVLVRGYAIAEKDGVIVKSNAMLAVGDALRLRLAEGTIITKVSALDV
jgi:exodeoxyribonuclease VII large subunit